MHIPLGRCALAGWVVPHINASLLGGLSCGGTTQDCGHLLVGRVYVATPRKWAETMQQYSIHKTGNQYVVRSEKDLLICESRREAEHIAFDVTNAAETSVSRLGL